MEAGREAFGRPSRRKSRWLLPFKALEQVGAPVIPGGQPSWKRDVSVLAWLDTLEIMWRNVGRRPRITANLAALLYIANCCGLLEVLREDNRAIVRAASQASKAADFILGFQPCIDQQAMAASADDQQEAA